MTLLGAQTGALFFPLLPEPRDDVQSTRIVRQAGKQYLPAGSRAQSIHLYHLEPTMALPDLQQRLRAILDLAREVLPPRPAPICEGIFLDTNTMNTSHTPGQANMLICPKKHIGRDVFDLVNVDTDCLRNPYLCHIMGQHDQTIVPPFRVRTLNQKS
jgi:hypothetical protein